MIALEIRGLPGDKMMDPIAHYLSDYGYPVKDGALYLDLYTTPSPSVRVRHTAATGPFVNLFDAKSELWAELLPEGTPEGM